MVADRHRIRVPSPLLASFTGGGIIGATGFEHIGFAATIPVAGLRAAMAAVPAFDDLHDHWRGVCVLRRARTVAADVRVFFSGPHVSSAPLPCD